MPVRALHYSNNAVSELGAGFGYVPPHSHCGGQGCLPRDAAQGHDPLNLGEKCHFAVEPATARGLFRGQRFIGRRGAPHGRDHPHIPQPLPVSGGAHRLVGRESRAVERRVQPVARAVAGEHPPRPVSPVGGGRQSHDHEPSVRVTVGRHGPTPIGLIRERGPFVLGRGFAPLHQSLAGAAHAAQGVQVRDAVRAVRERPHPGGVVRHGRVRRGRILRPARAGRHGRWEEVPGERVRQERGPGVRWCHSWDAPCDVTWVSNCGAAPENLAWCPPRPLTQEIL